MIDYIINISVYELYYNNITVFIENKDIDGLCMIIIKYIYNWCKCELDDNILDREGVPKMYIGFLIKYYKFIGNSYKMYKLIKILRISYPIYIHQTLVNIINL